MPKRASDNRPFAVREADFERADSAYRRGAAILAGHEDLDAARDKLQELRRDRDEAADRLHELRSRATAAVTVDAADLDDAPPPVLRDLIRATLERVSVAPGRGPDRVSFQPR